MIRIKRIRTFLLLAVLAAVATELQAEGLPPAVANQFEEINQVVSKAVVARDFDAWASVYTDDAVLNPPDEPAVKGRAAIRAWMEKLPQVKEFILQNWRVEMQAGLAYVLGNYKMTIAPPNGSAPIQDAGKFVIVLRKQEDGRWLCAVDMFSPDQPPPPAPGTNR